jgi:tungstate transport system ATP-binding protein
MGWLRRSVLERGISDMRDSQNRDLSAIQIEATELCLSIRNNHLLHKVSFVINTNGVTMVLGPNGAGKSLLLKCIHGLLHPSDGSIVFTGSNLNPKQAMVFQKPVLLRRSVIENMRFASQRQQPIAELEDALASVRLLEKKDDPATQLSGGEQQRLALARALITRPNLLLLDEPTASLDPASVLIIEELIQQSAKEGVKIIFISHDIGQAKRLAADVVFLNRGQIVEHSEATTFFTTPQSNEAMAYLNGEIVL